MKIERWEPGKPLGRAGALALCDPAIYDRVGRDRHRLGERPGYLDEALRHCSKQFIVRDLARDEGDTDPARREPQSWRDGDAYRHQPLRFARLNATVEVARLTTASTLARRSHKAVRALVRVLLRQAPPEDPRS